MASFHFRNEEINNQGCENCGKHGNSVEQMPKVPFQNKEIIVLNSISVRKALFKRGLEEMGKNVLEFDVEKEGGIIFYKICLLDKDYPLNNNLADDLTKKSIICCLKIEKLLSQR